MPTLKAQYITHLARFSFWKEALKTLNFAAKTNNENDCGDFA